MAANLLRPLSSHRSILPLPTVTIEFTIGDCLSVLRGMTSDSVDCCVTSPPYYFTRDYGDAQQIGLEDSPVEFLENLVVVFREVRRVLKPEGTLWLNIGDNYCTRRAIRADGKRTTARGGKQRSWADSARAGRTITGAQFRDLLIKEKDLFLLPHDLAQALRSDGWYVRGIFHWIKNVIVPERKRDAPCDAVEYIFLLSKKDTGYIYHNEVLEEAGTDGQGRPHRNVWEIAPSIYRSEHTAVMPDELAERCILTGSNASGLVLDPFGGVGTTATVAARYGRNCHSIDLNSDYTRQALQRVKQANRYAICRVSRGDTNTDLALDEIELSSVQA